MWIKFLDRPEEFLHPFPPLFKVFSPLQKIIFFPTIIDDKLNIEIIYDMLEVDTQK